MEIIYDLVPVVADIISAHCPGPQPRKEFVQSCLRDDWNEAREMVEGMLAEPQWLRGHQESRLREFLELIERHPTAAWVRSLPASASARTQLY